MSTFLFFIVLLSLGCGCLGNNSDDEGSSWREVVKNNKQGGSQSSQTGQSGSRPLTHGSNFGGAGGVRPGNGNEDTGSSWREVMKKEDGARNTGSGVSPSSSSSHGEENQEEHNQGTHQETDGASWQEVIKGTLGMNPITSEAAVRGVKKGSSWRDILKHVTQQKSMRATDPDVHKAYVTQPLNHYDPLDNRTWQQPYYYKDDEYKPGAPVYLYLGGEQTVGGNELKYTFPGELAKEQCAFMIVLQHRYYGDTISQYLDDSDLKYLSAEQAIQDVASFAEYATEQFNLTGPWLVIGCSYAGSLAAWTRATFPHIFSAAYSSSGPVLAKYDFHGYYDIIADVLEGVSKQCLTTVKSSYKAVRDLVDKKDNETINNLFKTCGPLDTSNADNVMLFYSNILVPFGIRLQYAQKNDAANICKMFTDTKDKPIEALAKYVRSVYPTCIQVQNENQYYSYYRHAQHDNSRLWIYQQCTEFGYEMAVNPTNKAFGPVPVTADYQQDICENIFDYSITPNMTKRGVARTNKLHGGANPTASRVLYVHGSSDPWSALRPVTDADKTSKIIFIKGTSHCYDQNVPLAWNEIPSAEKARATIRSTLRSWIPNTVKC